jgi:hypothetical protein
MIRRMFWFHLGMAVGISGYVWMKRSALELQDKLTLEALARSLGRGLQSGIRLVKEIITSALSSDKSSTV